MAGGNEFTEPYRTRHVPEMTTRKKIILLATIIAAIAAIVATSVFKRSIYRIVSDFQHPFSAPLTKAGDSTGRESLMMRDKAELADKLISLRMENERQAAEIAVLREVERSKKQLELLMELPPSQGFAPIFAEIVVRDPISWRTRFSINKGFGDGVSVGDVAMARSEEKGLETTFAVVGRVMEVSRHRALIETIASRDCRLGVVVEDNLAAGILEGAVRKNGRVRIRLSKLPVSKKYIPGAAVLTSGLAIRSDTRGSNVPSGLLVGRLARRLSGGATETVNNLTAEAEVIPAVDFDSLRTLAVMSPKGNPEKINKKQSNP